MMFQCAGVVLQQKVGLAMGGFCSPALAMIVCMMHEHSWSMSRSVRPHTVTAVRCVDDMTAVLPAGQGAGDSVLQSLNKFAATWLAIRV